MAAGGGWPYYCCDLGWSGRVGSVSCTRESCADWAGFGWVNGRRGKTQTALSYLELDIRTPAADDVVAGSPGPGITRVDGTGWGVGRKKPTEGAVATAILSCIRETDGLVRPGKGVVTEVAAAGPDSTLAGYVYGRHLSAVAE